MAFVYDREKQMLIDEERDLSFEEGGGRILEDVVRVRYNFRVKDTKYVRETYMSDNGVHVDFGEERDEYNMRKKTVTLGDDPWIHCSISSTKRIAGR